MKTDPRIACANTKEARGWAIVHDLLAHPFMALTGWSQLSLRFHDWTSEKAWPRISIHEWEIDVAFGVVLVKQLGDSVFCVRHPKVKHAFVTNASTPFIAARKASKWFDILAAEFGGDFSRN